MLCKLALKIAMSLNLSICNIAVMPFAVVHSAFSLLGLRSPVLALLIVITAIVLVLLDGLLRSEYSLITYLLGAKFVLPWGSSLSAMMLL